MSPDRQFFETFYDTAPDMYYSVDLETGAIEFCNDTLSHHFKTSKKELIGSPELELYSHSTRPDIESARQRLQKEKNKRVENVRAVLSVPEGPNIAVAWSGAAVPEKKDGPRAHIAVRDISDLIETERQLARRTRQLEQSNRELEQFAYLASHDLQEPLRMVASYTQLLGRRYRDELDERAKKYIDYAVDGANRMKKLLSDLLQYSRVGGSSPEMVELDTNQIIDEVKNNLRVRIANNNAQINCDNLPPVQGIHTDIVRLFQNLIENAIKFQKAEPKRVHIRADNQSPMVQFRVEDNGIGFDSSKADQIFQMFQRAHERDRFEGTGAGLAIVKKIVRAHGGTVSIDSRQKEGTTVSFTLPSTDKQP